MAKSAILDKRKARRNDKMLGNRQRFLHRVYKSAKRGVQEAIKKGKIQDISGGQKIRIPVTENEIDEPDFQYDSSGGTREYVVPGNEKRYVVGDEIPIPGSETGSGGKDGSNEDGDLEDEFVFELTREEFLSILFNELELPNLVKTMFSDLEETKLIRAGFSKVGSPNRINIKRTIKKGMGRRIAFGRNKLKREIKEIKRQISYLESKKRLTCQEATLLNELNESLKELKKKLKKVPFIDPDDAVYNRFEMEVIPVTKAVMFCLMDASASMTERLKDLAKRFFMLQHLFLQRKYKKVDIRFIRHTAIAKEVGEKEFFYGRETGGTVVSTAFEEMLKIVKEEFLDGNWNIYATQASDGHNWNDDNERCITLLNDKVMPIVQYFAYIEVADDPIAKYAQLKDSPLWGIYESIIDKWENFDMALVTNPSDIFIVFAKLFDKNRKRERR